MARQVNSPFTQADGRYQEGGASGSGSNTNIHFNDQAGRGYYAEINRFRSYIGDEILQQFMAVEQTAAEHLQMPLCLAQIRVVVEKMRAIVPRFTATMEAAERLVERHSTNLLKGHQEVAMNRPAADDIRSQCEGSLRLQAGILRGQAQVLRARAAQLTNDSTSSPH